MAIPLIRSGSAPRPTAFFAILLGVALWSITGLPKGAWSQAAPGTSSPAPAVIVTDADNSGSVTLVPGQTLIVRLPSRHDASGSWNLVADPQFPVQLDYHRFFADTRTGQSGHDGVEQFCFTQSSNLSAADGTAAQGGWLRLLFLPPSASGINNAPLWQIHVTVRGTNGAARESDLLAQAAGTKPLTDLIDAGREIHAALQKSLASLKVGDAAGYVAILAPEYQQITPAGTTQDKAAVLRSATADLAKHTYSSAEFGLTELRLVTAGQALVTVTQYVVTATSDTPPTVYKDGKGGSYTQSNVVTSHVITILHQTWDKRGSAWLLTRSQAVDSIATAIA